MGPAWEEAGPKLRDRGWVREKNRDREANKRLLGRGFPISSPRGP